MKNPSDFQPNQWQQLVRLDWASDRLHLHHADMAPIGSDRWLPVQRKQPPPDDLLYSRIGSLARVPAAGLVTLEKCISLELEREWRWYECPDRQILRSARDEVEAWKELLSELQARLSRPRAYALATLIWGAASIYAREASAPRPGGYGSNQFKNGLDTVAERASMAAELLHPEKPARARGRPNRGGFGEPIGAGSFKQFVLRLLWDIRTVGGELTLDKNRNTGTLLKVLKLLAPYLPPGLVPKRLPLSTLAGIHARAKTIAAADPLDKKLPAEDGESGPEKFTRE
jgi:hypothetical protein